MTDAPFGKAPDSNGNPRAISVRIKAASASKVGGQNAHDLRKGAQPAYVDQTRSHLNRILIDPLKAPQLRQIVTERRATRTTERALKSNAAIGTVGIITFGHLAQTFFNELPQHRQDEALKAVAAALAERLKTNVTGLVLHLDEEAPHAHFQLPAYDFDGNPLSQTTRRSALADLQTVAADVMKSFDPRFERGFRKQDREAAGATPDQVQNKTVADLHRTQAADIEKARATLAALNEKAEKNARLIAKAEAKIEAGKGDLEKLTKNIETYTRRRDAARFEAEQEEARLSAALSRSKKRQDEEAEKIKRAEEATLAAQAREKAALDKAAKEERRRDELTRANQEAAAALDDITAEKAALARAQDVIDRATYLAAENPAALLAPASINIAAARDIPPADWIKNRTGIVLETCLDRLEFGASTSPDLGQPLRQSDTLKNWIAAAFSMIRQIATTLTAAATHAADLDHREAALNEHPAAFLKAKADAAEKIIHAVNKVIPALLGPDQAARVFAAIQKEADPSPAPDEKPRANTVTDAYTPRGSAFDR